MDELQRRIEKLLDYGQIAYVHGPRKFIFRKQSDAAKAGKTSSDSSEVAERTTH
jgi:hypothetical protein